MNLRSIILTGAIVTLGYSSQAQQLPESNLYPFNKYGINPAYAGINGCTEFYASHLNQWGGIDGAPVTNYFSGHTALNDKMGLGGRIILDKASYVSRFSGRLSYAYGLKLGDDHGLRFGLSAGVYQVGVDATTATVEDVTDEVISGAQSGMTFDSEFGIFYHIKGFQLGLSIPQVFETRARMDFADLDGFSGKRHYQVYTGYDYQINDTWSIEPSLLYKTAANGLNQIDINTQVWFNKFISLGGGYRTHVGPLARLSVNIKEKLLLGYAYEFAGNNISSFSTGSHEIMLGFKICKGAPVIEEPKEDIVEEIVPEVIEQEVVEDTVEEVVEEEERIIDKQPPLLKEEFQKEKLDVKVEFGLNEGENADLSSNEGLDKLAEELKSHPNTKVTIIGHSCSIGSDEGKQIISDQRANKVKNYLLSKGVNPAQVTAKGVSDSKPLVPNSSEKNRQKNRRVEIIIE